MVDEQPGPVARKILVGYAFEPESRNALAYAARLADILQAGLDVVHITDLSEFSEEDHANNDDHIARGRAEVAAILTGFAGPWAYRVEEGKPLDVLHEAAARANALMVIIGTHGDQPGASLSRFLGGSLSLRLIRHLHHPLLVVPLVATKGEHSAGT